MCGIAAIYAYHYAANPVEREELVRIRDHMRRRGPDSEGLWLSADQKVGFGHRRLSIIDLSSGADQPMVSQDGRLVVNFNGEIYNFRALRQTLQQEGYTFRTDSDTEVLLNLYRARGEAMFSELRGMYAFTIWDASRDALLLARDPYGIKPLYYADDGWTVRIASQVKALLAAGRVSRALDPAGVVGFYLLGSVPEPYTLYRGIRAVPAGSFVWVTSTGITAAQSHFSIAQAWADGFASPNALQRSASDPQEALRGALLDSVHHHLVADVPVGAFLSSGIDSGVLVGLMRDVGQREITTVTVAFDEFQGKREDESPLASKTAQTYGADHRIRRVTRSEFFADLPALLEAMDQPSIDGINAWFVAKATAERGLKVAISGVGGDELFGGYPSFVEIPKWVRALRVPSKVPGAARLLRALPADLLPGTNPKTRGVLQFGGSYAGAWFLKRGLFMPWDLPALLDRDFQREGLRRLQLESHLAEVLRPDPGTAFGRIATLESALYMRNQLLRDTDWASMAHSLEVRVPYVDPILLRAIATLARTTGSISKAAVAATPATPLPEAVIRRAKTGFSTPVRQWLQEQADFDSWRSIPQLTIPSCPWARRWSHVIGSQFAVAA